MYKFYNANPLGRLVNDCTVRAISLATDSSWYKTFEELCSFAQQEAIMPDEVEYIDKFLSKRFLKIHSYRNKKISVRDFALGHQYGKYIITMKGHVTCIIDGCIYDTFDPSERIVWDAYKVE